MENHVDENPQMPLEGSTINGQSSDLAIPDSSLYMPMGDATMLHPMPPPQTISSDEIALYDRQIRLWGVKAQEMIRNANILIIGMKALGNEIAKNLVLAGIGGLTVLDHEDVTEEDLGSQFLITDEDVGRNRAEAAAAELRKMNPRVNITTDQESVVNKMPEYFATFNIVITTGQSFEMASTINMTCRMLSVKFYAADAHGLYGYIFSDLIAHQFVIEKDQGNIPTKAQAVETSTRSTIGVETKKENNRIVEVVTKQEIYCPLLLANSSPLPTDAVKSRRTKMRVPPLISLLRGLFEFQKMTGHLPATQADLPMFTKITDDKHMELQLPKETLTAEDFRKFLQNLGTEIPATAAFLGGQLAQDVINVLGQREQPLQNLLLFDGNDCKCPIYSMQPMLDPTLSMDPMSSNLPQDVNANVNGNGNITNGTGPVSAEFAQTQLMQ